MRRHGFPYHIIMVIIWSFLLWILIDFKNLEYRIIYLDSGTAWHKGNGPTGVLPTASFRFCVSRADSVIYMITKENILLQSLGCQFTYVLPDISCTKEAEPPECYQWGIAGSSLYILWVIDCKKEIIHTCRWRWKDQSWKVKLKAQRRLINQPSWSSGIWTQVGAFWWVQPPLRCHKGELVGAIASVTFSGTGATVDHQGVGRRAGQ